MTLSEIQARLKSKQMLVLKHVKFSKNHYPYEEWTVLYAHDGKAKIAIISSPYYYLHGPRVLATHNGRRAWFISGDVADDMPDEWIKAMENMSQGEWPTEYPEIDVTKIEITL